MTVGEMRDQMSNAEFVAWNAYHGRQSQRAELEQLKARRKG